jgi:hypothetical protein
MTCNNMKLVSNLDPTEFNTFSVSRLKIVERVEIETYRKKT